MMCSRCRLNCMSKLLVCGLAFHASIQCISVLKISCCNAPKRLVSASRSEYFNFARIQFVGPGIVSTILKQYQIAGAHMAVAARLSMERCSRRNTTSYAHGCSGLRNLPAGTLSGLVARPSMQSEQSMNKISCRLCCMLICCRVDPPAASK